jgi:glycine betaine/proline transport system permease protein/glycine betaine/proline transport system substrate-binding protein
MSACGARSNLTTFVAADAGWDSQKFHNALAKVIIEQAFTGYGLEFATASSVMNWESMKNGDVDFFIELWPNTVQTFHEDIESGDVLYVGRLASGSRSGIYVLRYVVEGDPARGIAPLAPNLRRVEDLIFYSHIFPDDENPSMGRLFGAIPGWRIDEILYKKFLYYGLDRNFRYIRLGSEAALFAAMMSAYNLGQPWVGYCYEPTWIAAKLPLILLEEAPFDPVGYYEGRTAFASQELLTVSSRQFPAKAPEIHEFLKNFATSIDLISEALAYLDETRATHYDTAVWFLKTHDAMIDEWLPAENARKLREYLSQK